MLLNDNIDNIEENVTLIRHNIIEEDTSSITENIAENATALIRNNIIEENTSENVNTCSSLMSGASIEKHMNVEYMDDDVNSSNLKRDCKSYISYFIICNKFNNPGSYTYCS